MITWLFSNELPISPLTGEAVDSFEAKSQLTPGAKSIHRVSM